VTSTVPRKVEENTTAPDFTLPADDGTEVRLHNLRGKNVVIFFYPKDDTPGCTIEAREFRDAHPRFNAIDTVVLGISPDNVASHCKFRDKYGLPYRLLADTDHTVAERYGVWVEKNMYGRKYMGVERSTFIIGRDGKVAKVYRKVKPEGHADEVGEAVALMA
jgi:peroxiredoxin Q/BCP